MMSSNEYDLDKAEELLKLPREDLLKKLSEDREPGFIGDVVREGGRIFARIVNNQREKICKDECVQAMFRDQTGNRRMLIVCAIADVVATSSAMTIGALIVQDGLESYCEAIWKPNAG